MSELQRVLAELDEFELPSGHRFPLAEDAARLLRELSAEVERLKKELDEARRDAAFYRDREKSICEAVGGVCDGGQFRADIISKLQAASAKAKSFDELATWLRKFCDRQNIAAAIKDSLEKARGA